MITINNDSRLALVFPGQGSQSVGMLADMAANWPNIIETFAEASAVLGINLWALVQRGPETKLNQTQNTQPAMLAAGVALWRVWQAEGGLRPALMAGHSLGEYTALVCADALNFADAVALVAERGRLMQEAVPAGQGAMAAILGMEDDQVIEVCKAAAQGEIVAAVNFNAPSQVVIAGTSSAVERAVVLAGEKGAKRAVTLPVSVPSHCELMRPAAEKLTERLRDIIINTPTVPVIHNVDVAVHEHPEDIRQALIRQLYSPVRWSETIVAMRHQGITTLVECGPGKVLTGLTKRINKQLEALPVFDSTSLNTALMAIGGK